MKNHLMMVISPEDRQEQTLDPHNTDSIDEIEGSLAKQDEEDKLMHSVLEGDKDALDDAKMLRDSFNQGVGAFVPNMMFEQMVDNFKMAKQLFGETIIRQLSGYDPGYVEKNINIPEFQREMKKHINQKIKEMKQKELIDQHGFVTHAGVELASLSLYIEELDHLEAVGMLGEKMSEKQAHYGIPFAVKDYRRGDRYKDLHIRKSVKKAIRRGHSTLAVDDLKTSLRRSKGKSYVVYALDASGSMKGKKIDVCKKAGVALAYKAMQEHDEVGLIVFGTDVSVALEPTNDFSSLLKHITSVRASAETDFVACLRRAIELFPDVSATKHVLLLTDAMPTVGDDPEQLALEAVEEAVSAGITISLVGIALDDAGKSFAEKVTVLGGGKFYLVDDLDRVDQIVLTDYYGL